MKYSLINPNSASNSVLETIMINRGIKKEDIQHYLNTTEKDICNYADLGIEYLKAGLVTILQTIKENERAVIIVDSDCDGFTSAAVLYNYLYLIFPHWVENNIDFFLHEGKQHGLGDLSIDFLTERNIKLVFCPDSSSNDYEEHKKLKDLGINVIVLDHHICDHRSEDAIIINNQLSAYPNKYMSGVGVVWQFCRYIDETLSYSFANNFLGLVATGLAGDMMDVRSYETRYLINRGMEEYNSEHNQFLYDLRKKNSFSIGNTLTCVGLQWYIVPYINAMIRSGTMEEKRTLFLSLLDNYYDKLILSTKRGHKEGDSETVATQVLRTIFTVKNRQKKAETAGMEILEKIIKEKDMLKEPVLLFLLDETIPIEPNIRGLVANKLMSKYQRPVIVSTKRKKDNIIVYSGSARNYNRSLIQDFKGLLSSSGLVEYAEGHQSACGVEFVESNIDKLQEFFRTVYKDVSAEPVYYVDYIFDTTFSSQIIQEIVDLKYLWGQEFNEPFVVVKDVELTEDNVAILSREKNPTLRITLPNGVEIMKFGLTDEEIEEFENLKKQKLITIVGTCSVNEWNGNATPQIFIKDYEIINTKKYIF